MGYKGPGTLFLMEFIVKKVEFLESALANKPELKIGKLVVLVRYLNFPLEIEEEIKAGKLVGKGDFKKGRSCIFSIKSLPSPSTLDAEFYVYRKRPDGVIPDKVTLGRARLDFSGHFMNIMKLGLTRPQELPICKAMQDTIEINDVNEINRSVGALTIILRATCLGKLVVTQLRKFGENSVLVKGNKDKSLYECESIVRKKYSSGLVQDQHEPEEKEKSLDEEFKHIIGDRKPLSEDMVKTLMKPSPAKASTLDDLEFTTFCDETNRLCLLYQQGEQCVPDSWATQPGQIERGFKLEDDGAGNYGLKMICSQPAYPPVNSQPPPIIKQQHSAMSKDDMRAKSSTGVAPGPSASRGRHGRTCKDCSRKTGVDYDWCPMFPEDAAQYHEPTSNEKLGIKVCEAECLPSPEGASPKKDEKVDTPVKTREPRTSSMGRALVVARMKGKEPKNDVKKTPKPKRQPLKILAPSKRPWEPDPNAPPEKKEPKENTAHFPPLQPYSPNTDIHIRTPRESDNKVFLMKMVSKTDSKPVLQLEVRKPKKPRPGEIPKSPEPVLPPPPNPPPPPPKPAGGKKGKKK